MKRGAWIWLVTPFSACGGGGSPTAPSTPPPPTFSVSAVVFYDEDGDGRLDAEEEGRLPGVVVDIGGRTAATELRTGRARVTGILGGARTASVRVDSLPPYWVAGDAVPVDVPTERELELAVRLPIGGNTPNLYMAFGDSITEGDGSSDGRGYIQLLEDRLRAGFGVGEVVAEGAGGTWSDEGAARLAGRLNRHRPAYTLILYGTNDWNPCDDVASCFTLESLASMIAQVKARDGLPVIATIPPVNVGFNERAPASRNDWVAEANAAIRALARSEGVVVADIEKVLLAAAGGNFSQLFVDHVHPNDRGYELIADEFYRAVSSARTSTNAVTALSLARSFEAPSPRLDWHPVSAGQRGPLDLGPLGGGPRGRVRDVTGPRRER
jgi:lysophospholipase L1-like esterase